MPEATAAPLASFGRQRRLFQLTTGVLVVLLFLGPAVYVLMIALESGGHFLRAALQPPTHMQFSNFASAWRQGDLGLELVNTAIYAAVAAGLSTLLSLLIAFPIARRLVRRSEGIYRLFVIGLFLPIAIIPLFIESRMLDLYNDRIGYILLHVEPGIPLGVVILTSAISTLPLELDEAAQIDGCPYWGYLRSVVVPVVAPGLVVTFLYSVLGVWNDILGPTVFLSSPNLYPISRGIFTFYGSHESDWTLLAAAIVVASLPVLALFIAVQRRLVQATIGGAIK